MDRLQHTPAHDSDLAELSAEPGVHPFAAGRPDRLVFQQICTERFPPEQRYDYWRSTVIRAAIADAPSPSQRHDFRATILSLADALSELHLASFDGFSARRSRAAARREDGEDPCLIWFRSGAAMMEQEGDAPLRLADGDFMLFNPLRATTVAFSQSAVVQIDLPRRALLERFGTIPDAANVARALRASPMGLMLRAQLDALSRILAELSPREQMAALGATEALALTILEAVLSSASAPAGVWDGGESPDPRRLALFTAAQRYIDRHLAHPSLDAATITQALGCSRSTLYRAFADRGLGISGYIREQRLQRFRALLQRAHPAIPIADLAARCGLYDAPNLSRLFRARFGMSPSEFRAGGALRNAAQTHLKPSQGETKAE